jgi:hypothetical protein
MWTISEQFEEIWAVSWAVWVTDWQAPAKEMRRCTSSFVVDGDHICLWMLKWIYDTFSLESATSIAIVFSFLLFLSMIPLNWSIASVFGNSSGHKHSQDETVQLFWRILEKWDGFQRRGQKGSWRWWWWHVELACLDLEPFGTFAILPWFESDSGDQGDQGSLFPESAALCLFCFGLAGLTWHRTQKNWSRLSQNRARSLRLWQHETSRNYMELSNLCYSYIVLYMLYLCHV